MGNMIYEHSDEAREYFCNDCKRVHELPSLRKMAKTWLESVRTNAGLYEDGFLTTEEWAASLRCAAREVGEIK